MIKVGENSASAYMSNSLKSRKKIESLGETDIPKQDRDYFQKYEFDTEFVNYVKETVPKTIWKDNYLQELWEKQGNYLKTVRERQSGYGFDDICTGAAYAYSTMYQEIVEGYRNGTRELYVCDNPESGERRLLTMDEELAKLNKGFEELIKWEQMVAKSQTYVANIRQKYQNIKLDGLFDNYDVDQACGYIRDSYLEFRSLYLEQYEKMGGSIDIKSLFSSILRSGNHDMHRYCEFLFEKIGLII